MATFRLVATARAIDRITTALGDASTSAAATENRVQALADAHAAYRQHLQQSIPEVAGYLETIEKLIAIITDPNTHAIALQKAKESLANLGKIVEMFDRLNQFDLNDFISSAMGKDRGGTTSSSAPGGTSGSSVPPAQSSGSIRTPRMPPSAPPPSSEVTPPRTPPATPPPTTRPSSSTGRYKP